MIWTAIVPLKQGAYVKSRLSERLTETQRQRLSVWMAEQVIAALNAAESVGRVLLVSETAGLAGEYDWFPAPGRGLNQDLELARQSLLKGPYLIVHGDLPLLAADDIEALTDAAERSGCAIAPDQAGSGTNALAIRDDMSFPLQFGEESFSRHAACAPAGWCCVQRPGLSLDVDSPEDLEAALSSPKGPAIGFLLLS